jgi:formylmethanofuran dehydrogenase subunit E
MKTSSLNFDECLKAAKEFHGDVCAGIIIGTRMSILGMKLIGINDPKGKDRKDLIVYVEIDRCATDAILAVTGCHPGKRTMKILDYGKMAATFINLKTGKAVRIAARNKDTIKSKAQEVTGQNAQSNDGVSAMTDEELFIVEEVNVKLKPEDLPGKPIRAVACSVCGERIMDFRDIVRDGKIFCKPCLDNKRYYKYVN